MIGTPWRRIADRTYRKRVGRGISLTVQRQDDAGRLWIGGGTYFTWRTGQWYLTRADDAEADTIPADADATLLRFMARMAQDLHEELAALGFSAEDAPEPRALASQVDGSPAP